MLDFLSDEVRRNPYPLYDSIRAASPLLFEPGLGVWMVFDYAGVKRVLNDHESFSSSLATSAGQPSPPWFIFFDPPRHTRLRGLVSTAFTPRMIANLEPRIRELSRELLDRSIERGEMDLAGDFAVPLPLMVIAEMIGISAAEWPRFKQWNDVILRLSYTLFDKAAAARATTDYFAVREEMRSYLAGQMEQRLAEPKDGLLTNLANAEVEGERLTPDEIVAFTQLLLIAGNETTANLIGNAMLSLVENPEQLARLRTAPVLLPSAIEEVLRYRSPLQYAFRATTRDVDMHGMTIPAGKLVLPMIGSANRDPVQFADANRFEIARNPNPHIAFGHGIHFCLGAALSRLEARIALAELLDQLQNIQLAGDEPWTPKQALNVLGPAHLPIRFDPGRRATASA